MVSFYTEIKYIKKRTVHATCISINTDLFKKILYFISENDFQKYVLCITLYGV